MKHLDLIKNNEQLKLIIKLAQKTQVLKFSPQSSEVDTHEVVPGYKREGFYAEDVTGFWMPDSFKTYLQGNLENLKTGVSEFGWWRGLSFLSLKLPWSGWAFVVEAKKTIPHDIATARLANLRKNKVKTPQGTYEKILSQISSEDVKTHLQENYLQISPAIWVSPKDPSCFIYDEDFKPFALKDGWSGLQLQEVMQEWFEALTGEKISAKLVLNAPW